jgi:hypothetical protein
VNDLEQMTKSGKFDKEKYRVGSSEPASLAYSTSCGRILPESIDRRA